jgi:3-carboxy-cis,cis-muconate cycloisomerase
VAGGLQVDRERMLVNIDSLQGLVFAEAVSMHFAQKLGKARAHSMLEQLSQDTIANHRHLRDAVLQAVQDDESLRGQFEAADLAALFDAKQAAQRAITVAQPQLDTLNASAQQQAASAPWSAWLED